MTDEEFVKKLLLVFVVGCALCSCNRPQQERSNEVKSKLSTFCVDGVTYLSYVAGYQYGLTVKLDTLGKVVHCR